MENNSSGGSKKIYIAIIAFLILMNGAAIYLLYTDTKAMKELKAQKTALQGEYNNLTDTLNVREAELETLKGKNSELDSIIVTQQLEIEKQKKTIASLFSKGKMTGAEMAKAKALISEYQSTVSAMKAQIEELIVEKQILTEQNQQLSSDLVQEKRNSSQLSEQNKGLSKKVVLGSLLQLKSLEVAAIRKKSNSKEVEVSRIKQLESLRIVFEAGENKVLEPGELSLFIRIVNPKGETISVADQGSGSLKLAETGETIQYSKKADIDWTQSSKKVSVYWSQNIKEAGVYKVEIYQSGYLIGKEEVELK